MNARAGLPAWVHAAGVDDAVRTRVLAGGGQGEVVAVDVGPDGRFGAAQRIVLKRFDRLAAGRNAAAAMRAVGHACTADAGVVLRVPSVLDWRDSARVLVQTAAPGTPVLPLLATARRPRVLETIALALAGLHAAPVRVGRLVGIDDHVRDLMRPHPHVVAERVPGVAHRVEAVLAALGRRGRQLPPGLARPIHRDAHARQMFLHRARVWLVDWDLFARGDPALDVANFAVYLRTHLDVRPRAAARQFLQAYARLDASVSDRVPLFTAVTYLRLVCKTYRLQRAGWRPRLGGYLRRAEEALDLAGTDL